MSDEFGATAILNEAPIAESDLSRRIERIVAKDPLDRVKCVRIYDDFYRCNWWSYGNEGIVQRGVSAWGEVAMQRVRKSRFLRATIVAGELVIQEILSPAG